MYDDDGFSLPLIGPQSDGTYGIPTTAQQSNSPWDSAGGIIGQYSDDIKDLFKLGIGAWAADRSQQRLIDYKRVEATNGGAFVQGQPAMMAAGQRQISLLPLLLMGGLAFLVLKK